MVQTMASARSVAPETPSILSKAFELLRAFNQVERVMTLSELARATNLPKSTVHRLLARLIELDVIEHHRQGYRLGLSFIQLGATTPAAGMREVAAPHLAALHHAAGHTVHLAVLRQFEVVYLEKLSSRGSTEILSSIGGRLPASCTALGKAILSYQDLDQLRHSLPRPLPQLTPRSIPGVDAFIAQLRRARAQGIAHATEESQLGMSCIAAPILVNGMAHAAISVSYPTATPHADRIEAAVRVTARRLAADATVKAASLERWLPRDYDKC
jgi:DNA-binding IclR family transcriptional regulator